MIHDPASATLVSCDLRALLFSNNGAFRTVSLEGALLLKSLNCDFNDASSDSLVSSIGSVEFVDYSVSNTTPTSSVLRGSGDASLRGCTFTSLFLTAMPVIHLPMFSTLNFPLRVIIGLLWPLFFTALRNITPARKENDMNFESVFTFYEVLERH
ncbi:hypothetical protein BLNAU_22780 [Blattamonas nauphoetae]|uniref:Uncharacterized protein n=1 Tax=Blattamonas nauphoetae TaxID=2049346 RepID=A0ABQ9WS54_9EUKA|nr:hypothetical protein BLNAU_22780 [Blattamonas nauphoetae]